MAMWTYLLLLVASTFAISSTQILMDNAVKGFPKIDCSTHSVNVHFDTERAFQGHVYIRGHYHDDNCHKDYLLNSDNFGSMTIPFEKCGMRRQRSTNPKGMSMSATVITSFHRTFVTSVDKAYHINCFYMEADKEVTQGLSVSDIPTVTLSMNPPMPDCKYDVLIGGPEGTPARFANVGDKVYHKWNCKNDMQEMYCMIIHSCFVEDGESSVFEVIDDKGCSKDPVILEDLSYITDLMAGTEASVFKFADKSHVIFGCQIRLSLKHEHENEICPRPQCNVQRRFRFHRDVEIKNFTKITDEDIAMTKMKDFDLTALPIVVMDLDDNQNGIELSSSRQNSKLSHQSYIASLFQTADTRNKFCISGSSFGVMISATALAFLTTVVFTVLYCIRKRRSKN